MRNLEFNFINKPYTEREAWSFLQTQGPQLNCSIRKLAFLWKWHKSKVERFLKILRAETLIETETGTDATTIKVNKLNGCKLSELFDRDKIETATETPLAINLINLEELSPKTILAEQNRDSFIQTSETAQAEAGQGVAANLETAKQINARQDRDNFDFIAPQASAKEKEKQEKKKSNKKRKEQKEKEKTPLKGGKKEKIFKKILDQDFDNFDEAELLGDFEELKEFKKHREFKNSYFEQSGNQANQVHLINSSISNNPVNQIVWDSFIDQASQTQINKTSNAYPPTQSTQTNQPNQTNIDKPIDRIIDDIEQLEVSDVANWAEANLPAEIDLEWELEKFKDYCRASLKTQPQNLVAAFRNWLRKALEFKRLRDKQAETYANNRKPNSLTSTESSGSISFKKFLSSGMKVINEISQDKQTDNKMLVDKIIDTNQWNIDE